MSENSEKSSDFVIKNIDNDQLKCIENLFREKNWKLDVKVFEEISDTQVYQCSDTQYKIDPIQGETRCLYCFCQPCVTNEINRQQWWGTEPTTSRIENSGRRKKCYQRF